MLLVRVGESQDAHSATQTAIVHISSLLPLVDALVEPFHTLQVCAPIKSSHHEQPPTDHTQPHATPSRVHSHYRGPFVCLRIIPETGSWEEGERKRGEPEDSQCKMQSEEIIDLSVPQYQRIISKTELIENLSYFESDQSDGGLHLIGRIPKLLRFYSIVHSVFGINHYTMYHTGVTKPVKRFSITREYCRRTSQHCSVPSVHPGLPQHRSCCPIQSHPGAYAWSAWRPPESSGWCGDHT